jgi:ariadne-1
MTQSIKLDETMYKSQLKKQDLEVKEQWFKIDFVKEAVCVLLRSRRSLAESFIFAYFYNNDDDNQWIRFQLNQTELQKATEDLSHILETQVNGDNFHTMKRQLTDAVNYCAGCHRAMFDHVKEGFSSDMWTKK